MSYNVITSDKIATKTATQAFRDGHDRVFGRPAAMACTRCGGAHALSECKWPLVAEVQNQQGEN